MDRQTHRQLRRMLGSARRAIENAKEAINDRDETDLYEIAKEIDRVIEISKDARVIVRRESEKRNA